VIDEAIRLNKSGVDCPLAIETSGHAAFRENDFTNDGMYLATLLVCQTLHGKRNRKKLTEPLESLDEPVECNEKRFPITADDFRAKGLELIDRVMDDATEETDRFLAPDNREGVRINFNLEEELSNAWMLLRLSVHDPVVVLNMESDVEGGIAYMENHLRNLIIDMTGIDFSTL
jgi:phosphomannomutase